MRRKIRGDVIWGGLALLIFVFLSVARSAQDSAAPVSVPSSYDTGRYGYRALHDLLAQEAVPVGRFEANHHYLDHRVSTLVIAVSPSDFVAGDTTAISRNEDVAIKDWVRAGGHLVVLASKFGDAEDTMLGIPATHERRAPATTASPLAPLALLRGVRWVHGAFRSEFAWSASPKAVPLLVTTTGIVAMRYRLGTGSVTAITDAEVFGNARLRQGQNARFAVQLLDADAPRLVAFDEAFHGYAQNRTLWQALPKAVHFGVYLAGFAVLLSVLGNLVRFAPPLEIKPLTERDSSAYITSMANLLARAHASRKALHDAAGSALRSVRRALGASERTRITELLPRLQEPEQRKSVLELDRLSDLEHPSDAELLRAGILSAQLRKDFGL